MTSSRPTLLVAAVLLLLLVTAQALPRGLQQQKVPDAAPKATTPTTKEPICTCMTNPVANSCTGAVAVSTAGAAWQYDP
jgi:hypothetical protein